MRIMNSNDNWNKINTKVYLKEVLSRYNGVLNKRMVDYLNSLIELEFSAIRDYISIEDKEALSQLDVYRKIVTYNIYNRAIELFEKEDKSLEIFGNTNGLEKLSISKDVNDKKIKLFNFFYNNSHTGKISLYKSINDDGHREEELERVMDLLECLYGRKNPYDLSVGSCGEPICGALTSKWAFDRANMIREYEKKIEKLKGKKLSSEELSEIELTKKYYDLLLEDYGLCEDNFCEVIKGTNLLQKTLIKKLPGIEIKSKIKYI